MKIKINTKDVKIAEDLKILWEESQTENTRLRLQLGDVKTELDSVKTQLEAMAMQAVNNKSMSDAEKREKKVVLKKLGEMEEELKVRDYFHQILCYEKYNTSGLSNTILLIAPRVLRELNRSGRNFDE